VPILGAICLLVGVLAFFQLSSESYQAEHGEWQEKIALTLFATLFSVVGFSMAFLGFFLKQSPDDSKESKFSSGRLSAFLAIFMVVALLKYLGNWSWQRLEGFADNVVYVEFPKRFIYDTPGTYDFPLAFYQYKPSVWGNKDKHYLDIDPGQYQLSVAVKDNLGEESVSVTGTKLQIRDSGDYVLAIEIKEGTDTAYTFKREFPFHDILLKYSKNINTWVAASPDTVPGLLQQLAKIQVDSFGYRDAASLTTLQDSFYLNDSLDFIKISFGESDKKQLKTRPQGPSNSFFYGHQGVIYSFGGTLFGSTKQPNNMVYTPESNEWQTLPAIPMALSGENEESATVVAVYSVAEVLFVLVRAEDHFLYQFDPDMSQPWTVVKQFSIDDDRTNWQFLDEKTLVAYFHRQSDSDKSGNQFVEGYLKLLDLESYQIQTLSTTSTIISYASDYYNLHAYENSLYLHSNGRFYLLTN
jgi:hypothetical protein